MKKLKNGFILFFALFFFASIVLCIAIFGWISPTVTVPPRTKSPEIINGLLAQPMGKPVIYFPEEIKINEQRQLYNIPLSESEQSVVERCCLEFDVPEKLVLGIIGVESGYKNCGISSTDDWGIMQINRSNHQWLTETLGVSDFLDYAQNVRAGSYMLSRYWKKYCNFVKAAMCYKYGDAGAQIKWESGIVSDAYTDKFNQIVGGLEKS